MCAGGGKDDGAYHQALSPIITGFSVGRVRSKLRRSSGHPEERSLRNSAESIAAIKERRARKRLRGCLVVWKRSKELARKAEILVCSSHG